jgi:hypothetical protein
MTITISAQIPAASAVSVESATVTTITTLLDSIGDANVTAASMTTDTQGTYSWNELQ